MMNIGEIVDSSQSGDDRVVIECMAAVAAAAAAAAAAAEEHMDTPITKQTSTLR